VRDFANFSFNTRFFFQDFQFLLNFSGSHTSFLGDGVLDPNSSLDLEYFYRFLTAPSIVPNCSIILSSETYFTIQEDIHFLTSYIHSAWPHFILTPVNSLNLSAQPLLFETNSSFEGKKREVNGTQVPFTFNYTSIMQNVEFHIADIPIQILFEFPIRQMILEPEKGEENTEGSEKPEEQDTNTRTIDGFHSSYIAFGMVSMVGGLWIYSHSRKKLQNRAF